MGGLWWHINSCVGTGILKNAPLRALARFMLPTGVGSVNKTIARALHTTS